MVGLPTHCIAYHLLLHFWLHGSAVVGHIALFGTCCLLAPASPWVASSPRCQMLWRTQPHSDISVTKIQSPSPRSSGCLQGHWDWTIRDSPSPLSLWSPSGLFLLLLPVFHSRALGILFLSTWTQAACHWVCGTGHWGCACLAGTCRGTGLCCWEPPTRCRCCRRADSKSALHTNGLQWEEEEEE